MIGSTDGGEISVIIPARNAARTIGETLASLGTERGVIREIIVVENGSRDDTEAAAMRAGAEHGLPVRTLPRAAGDAGAARNAGISAATGRYVYFIDADDLHVAGGLRALLKAMAAHPDAGIAIGAHTRNVDGKGLRTKRPPRLGPDQRRNSLNLLSGRAPSLAVGSILLRSDAIGERRFPESLAYDEDTIFWARILADTTAVAVEDEVLVYRVDSDRANERFLAEPRANFLRWLREAKRLAPSGRDRIAIRARAGVIAFKLARTHYAAGDHALAERFIRLAMSLSAFDSAYLRMRRYRRRIAAMPAAKAGFLPALPDIFAVVVSVEGGGTPVSGVELRNRHNVEALAAFGAVLVLSLTDGPKGKARSDGDIFHASLSVPGDRNRGSIARRRTRIDVRITRAQLERLVAALHRLKPRLVLLEGMPLMPLAEHVRPLAPRLIVDMHNVESHLVALAPAPGRRIGRHGDEAAILRERERRAAELADRIWVCSEVDRERLAAICVGACAIDVVPNAIPRFRDLPDALAAKRAAHGGPSLLYVGHLGYAPNVTAVRRLATRIVPALAGALPGIRLAAAGRSPAGEIRALAAEGRLTLAEAPDDLSALYAAADLVVVPLTEGGGTRIKILEAMAYGVPVVATAVAAEGLDFVPGEEIVIADTDEEIAEAVRSLASDADRRESLRRRAFDAARARYGEDTVKEAVARSLR